MDVHSHNVSSRDAPLNNNSSDVVVNTNTTTGSTVSNAECFHNDVTNRKSEDGNGPNYKDQCQSVIPTLNLSFGDVVATPNIVVRRSPSPTLSSSTINRSHIPLVCGVLLSENENMSDTVNEPHSIFNVATQNHHNNASQNESEVLEIRAVPEHSSVPRVISVKNREKVEGYQESNSGTLSNAEKRYWIKVVLIAIIVNTCLVLGGVIGGVCGISHCHFTNETKFLSENDIGVNNTESPTPAPSRRLVTSDTPVVDAVSGQAPTFESGNTTTISAPNNDLIESISSVFPSVSPMNTLHPTTGPVMTEPVTTRDGINLLIIIPIAIVVDAMLIIGYLFYHYAIWINSKTKDSFLLIFF